MSMMKNRLFCWLPALLIGIFMVMPIKAEAASQPKVVSQEMFDEKAVDDMLQKNLDELSRKDEFPWPVVITIIIVGGAIIYVDKKKKMKDSANKEALTEDGSEKIALDKTFNELMNKVYEVLQPIGYKKDGQNFRLFETDGLCKIINFQKHPRNSSDKCQFIINVGIYFEKENPVSYKKFKEYECQIRERKGSRNSNVTESGWWCLCQGTDIEELFSDIKRVLVTDVQEWFAAFSTKERTINMILNGEAGRYTDINVMNYITAKLLVDMGYSVEVYEVIKDTKTTYPKATAMIELAERIKPEDDANLEICRDT